MGKYLYCLFIFIFIKVVIEADVPAVNSSERATELALVHTVQESCHAVLPLFIGCLTFRRLRNERWSFDKHAVMARELTSRLTELVSGTDYILLGGREHQLLLVSPSPSETA